MYQEINQEHDKDEQGRPAGGLTTGEGITIRWQRGPLGRHADGCTDDGVKGRCVAGCTRVRPNGAFVEGVIAAAIGRIEHYQDTEFKCRENAIALTHLETALLWMGKRTADRERRKVEGTHES